MKPIKRIFVSKQSDGLHICCDDEANVGHYLAELMLDFGETYIDIGNLHDGKLEDSWLSDDQINEVVAYIRENFPQVGLIQSKKILYNTLYKQEEPKKKAVEAPKKGLN